MTQEYPIRYTPVVGFPSRLPQAQQDNLVALILRDSYYCGPRGRLDVGIQDKLRSDRPGRRRDALDAVARFEALLEREGYFGPELNLD